MAAWRTMTPEDAQDVLSVANLVHTGLPERGEVFAERAKLFPEGSLVLVENNEVCGYGVSHPIRSGQPPALDTLLGEIAPDADQYYIHDVAILPKHRGRGFATQCIWKLLAVAERYTYSTSCLVSVYGTSSFWAGFGFDSGLVDPALEEKLRGYGKDAAYLMRPNARNQENS
ncbi:hypothetical protein MFIFM68171_08362 [Madurella fahalii]|uniref:N-acetyltransferase domain-containing protein n=1 Tax=Madurella fahalii TaxID=1157608 RepID=A0ABQ0GK58_9PEZI